MRLGLQDGPQDEIVLQDQVEYRWLTVPVRAELEMRLDLYGKKARVSLIMLMYSCMPLSYHTILSSGMARVFFRTSFRAPPGIDPPQNAPGSLRHPITCVPHLPDN